MVELLDKIILKDKIEYAGSISEFKDQLNESTGKNFNVEWISELDFKLLYYRGM